MRKSNDLISNHRTFKYSLYYSIRFDSFHHVNSEKKKKKNGNRKNAIYFTTSEKKWKIFRNKFTLSCSDLNSAYSQRGRKCRFSKHEFYQRIHRHYFNAFRIQILQFLNRNSNILLLRQANAVRTQRTYQTCEW